MNFAFLQMTRRSSASTCELQENPFSSVNAAAEMIASSKFVSVKYKDEKEDAVERFSLMS